MVNQCMLLLETIQRQRVELGHWMTSMESLFAKVHGVWGGVDVSQVVEVADVEAPLPVDSQPVLVERIEGRIVEQMRISRGVGSVLCQWIHKLTCGFSHASSRGGNRW